MITRADALAAEQAVIELQEVESRPTADLAGESLAESAASLLPAPASPSGAVLSRQGNDGQGNKTHSLDAHSPDGSGVSLEADAAAHLEIAAEFVRAGRRFLAREEIKRAVEKLNEAEIED